MNTSHFFSRRFQVMQDDTARWCDSQNRASLLWRAPFLLYGFYAGFLHIVNAQSSDIFSLPTFLIHELGHIVFSAFGHWIMMSGGSFWQLLVPIIVLAMFRFQRDFFGVAVVSFWLSSSLFNLAVYIGDARAQTLELVNPGMLFDPNAHVEHDWHFLLSSLNLLPFDTFFAFLTRLLAIAILLFSLGFASWLCVRIARRQTHRFAP